MGKKSRNKGKAGEREAAAEISRVFGVAARRGVQFAGGPDSPDVVHDIAGMHVEVKRCEALKLYAAIDQAVADCGSNIPVVLHRRNHQPWVAVVKLDDLPRLATLLAPHATESVSECGA